MEHSEVQELKSEITSLRSELGAVGQTLVDIKVTLAKMEGANLQARVFSLEQFKDETGKKQASVEWIPAAITGLKDEVKALNQFRWKAVGVLLVLQTLLTGAAVALVRWFYEMN